MATTNPALKSGDKYGDLKRRLWFLLGALVVYRIGTHIPVPGINASVLDDLFRGQQGGILGLLNVFSGGALSRFSIFALGIMPYISASIIMQLCTVVMPSLEALKKEGEAGRRKITQYTRYATLGPRVLPGASASRWRWRRRPGLVIEPGLVVPHPVDGHAGDGHDVPDVAGRADHRARSRQRHFADHLRGHRGGAARARSARRWSRAAPARTRGS